jgi:hypothetical protein
MKLKYFIYLSLLGLCGCEMIPISDEQIEEIAVHVSEAAEAGAQSAKPLLDPIIPGLTNVVSVLVGMLTGAGTRVGLKALQKKKREDVRTAILEAQEE